MTLGTRSDEGTAKWDAIGRNGTPKGIKLDFGGMILHLFAFFPDFGTGES